MIPMAKIIRIESYGPQPLDPDTQPAVGLNAGHQLVARHLTDVFEELTFQLSSGELKTCRRWFNPKTNSQRMETKAADEMLSEMPSLESQEYSNKKRRHRNRKTRALGNRLYGEASRTDSRKQT
jgi:hypothetical protein